MELNQEGKNRILNNTILNEKKSISEAISIGIVCMQVMKVLVFLLAPAGHIDAIQALSFVEIAASVVQLVQVIP